MLTRVDYGITIQQNKNTAITSLEAIFEEEGLSIHRFTMESAEPFIPEPVTLEWKIAATDIMGVWRPTADFNKRIEADWELQNQESRISIDAPVLSLFGIEDKNVLTFSCSNAINRLELAAKYREEDNCFYCKIIFFTECKYPLQKFSADIRLDRRDLPFYQALKENTAWWESQPELLPTDVPAIAKKPLYSTWYQFHQELEEELLLEECRRAKAMGFEAIIIDDGWQTQDSNRGYDYTGDWRPERFSDFGNLVAQIQEIGLAVGLWYSVPFCGKKSKAYNRFKHQFLTEDHRWAPVLDPRYKEVRDYLVQTYVDAVKDWNLDGLKLDFIDDFKKYESTPFNKAGMDTASINQAVDRLLGEVIFSLKKIRPDIFIEFRQKYTGPAMKKFGNMLRAFDCPGDFTMNRIRIVDIRLLAGKTAVHSDMVKWHFKESVEVAALHYMNTLFGVPQLSVMLSEAPADHQAMIRFYTQYWSQNQAILTEGEFIPKAPLQNYPLLLSKTKGKTIVGLFGTGTLDMEECSGNIDVLNARIENQLVLLSPHSAPWLVSQFSCTGELVSEDLVTLNAGANLMEVPSSGLIQLKIQSS